MSPTAWAVARPVGVSMLFVLLFVTGLVGGQRVPLAFLPDISYPALAVEIPYRNATPSEIERRITRPAEDALATVGNIEGMRSRSSSDGASIFVHFGWDTDLSRMSMEVRDRLEAARSLFPDDVTTISVRRFDSGSLPVLNLRLSAERDLSDAYELLQRHFVRAIERQPGVSQVEIYGVQPDEVRIALSAARMAAHNIALAELSARLRRANFQRAGGHLDSDHRRYRLRQDGQLDSVEAVRAQIIRDDGLRLGDIADVRLAQPVPEEGRRVDGRPAVGVNVYKASDANLVAVADAALAEIARVREVPALSDLDVQVRFNAADDVRSSLDDLVEAGLLGALFALVVLYAFVREWRTTLLVTAAVPLSLTVTLGVMYFAGYSLNVLTLTGLMLSVGMLVDNAVVVSESVHRHRLAGADARDATLSGVRRVALAVTAGTATSAIVFLPNIVGAENQVTIYLSHVAVTIAVSLAASLAVALLLIPQLTARLPAPRPPRVPAWLQRVPAGYERLLAWTLSHRRITTLLVIAFVASVALPAQWVRIDLFPREEASQIELRYNLHGSYALDTVRTQAVEPIEAHLLTNRAAYEIEGIYTHYRQSRAETVISLLPEDARTQSSQRISERILEALPPIAIGRPDFQSGRIGQADPMAVRIRGDGVEAVTAMAQALEPVLRGLSEVATVGAEDLASAEELRVRVIRERAQNFGLSAQDVAEVVAGALRGAELDPLRGPGGEHDMLLELRASDRADIDALRSLPLQGADGERLVLGQIAELGFGGAPDRISRHDRRTAVELQFTTAEDVTPQDARAAIAGLLDAWTFAPGTGWSFGAAFDREAEAMNAMMVNMLLALALIYLIMAALFESWLAPSAIVSSVGFAVIGVFWFFAATGTSFTVMALIGVLVLMGIVVNNGIVLIDLVQRLRREGVERTEALLVAGRERLRPIVMTALTTILGMVPLALGDVAIGGEGPPYYPMARAVIGGLLIATVLTLLALPLVYTLLDDLARWSAGVARTAVGGAAGTARGRT